MPFVRYINFKHQYLTRIHAHLWKIICMGILLSGCSHFPNEKNPNEKSDVKRISKNITDLVNLPENNKDVSNVGIYSQISVDKSKNDYLAQEKYLMSGISEDIIKTYQNALFLMDQKQWTEAMLLFDKVIEQQENLSGSYINQALILKKLSSNAKGDEREQQINKIDLLLDKAISINPTNPYAHYHKGQSLQDKGQFELAEQSYTKALTIWPNYVKAQLSLAVLLELYRGKLLEAYQLYNVYLANESNNQQVKRWQAALAIKIKRSGLLLPENVGEKNESTYE